MLPLGACRFPYQTTIKNQRVKNKPKDETIYHIKKYGIKIFACKFQTW